MGIEDSDCELLDINQFNNKFGNINCYFSFFHVNVVSLNKNANILRLFIESIKVNFDLILLTEIRNINLQLYSSLFTNYEYYFNKSTDIATGGAAIFVTKKYIFKRRDDLTFSSSSNAESIFIEIKHKKRNQIVGCVYRHPQGNINTFKNDFLSIVKVIRQENKDLWVMGDFNINLLNKTIANKYLFDFNLLNCKQLMKHPTRITNKSSTLIDHVYSVSFNTLSYFCGCIDNDFSDHKATFLLLSNFTCMHRNSRPLVRIFSENNLNKFSHQLTDYSTQFQLNFIESKSCIENENKWNCFINTMQNLFENSFPLRLVSKSKIGDKNWMNNELKKKCKHKYRLYKKYKVLGTVASKTKYLTYKRTLEKEIYNAKANYYSKYLSSDFNNKKLWKHINSTNHQSSSSIDNIIVNGLNINDPVEICNQFNMFFNTIGSTQNKTKKNLCLQDYLQNNKTSFSEIPKICFDEVKVIINSLKNSNSCGHDLINSKLIKMFSDAFSVCLTRLINDSILTFNFPTILKTAKIVPIFKSNDKTNIANYRPISLLSNFSKIFEKHIHKHLNDYLIKNNLLMSGQHGYRKFHNCMTCVSSVHDYICNKLEKKRKVVSIFLDLSKAFDSIDHEILLNKINQIGIKNNELQLFESYLKNRNHFTLIKGVRSNISKTIRGVPQGSILGPTLYSLFCNDLSFFNSHDSKIFLYADDTSIIIDADDYISLQNRCNELMTGIYDWFCVNKLTINQSKSKFMNFSKDMSLTNLNICVHDSTLEQVTCLKYLGIKMQNNLQWNQFASDKIKSLINLKHLFKYYTNYLPLDKMVVLFKALYFSRLIYGIEFLGKLPNYLLNHLQIIQNAILKIIFKKNKRFSTLKLHKLSNFLLVKDILFQRQCLFIFDEQSSRRNNEFAMFNNLRTCREVHPYLTRNRNNIFLGKFSSISNKKIFNSCSDSYNSLPNNIKNITSRNDFKCAIENFLLNKY